MLAYTVNASGCAVEVKSSPLDKAAWNEFYCNMLGSETKIATQLLESCKIVQEITVYGIVVSMQNSDNA